jgi:long-chain acyl-CoA synthetase
MTTSPSPTAPRTLNELFLGAIARYRERPVAMRWKPEGAGWTPISYVQLSERVRSASLALANLGVRSGDRVAILAENRPEWAIVDYAALALGAADVPIYPTLPAAQVEYILRNSGAVVAFASSQAMLDKLLEVRPALPALRHVIAFDGKAHGPDVLAFTELEALGRALPVEGWEATALMARPDDLATIIYTSGTTGNPKGVMLTHGNITSNVIAGLQRIPIQDDPGQQECLSFLPLSHIFERMAGHYLMLHAGAIINYAGSIDTVSADMGEIRPTLMFSVPRLYEKIHARVQENAMAGSAAKRQIFRWAKRVGETCVDLTLAGKPVPLALAAQRGVADRLVFRKLRDRTGNRLRFFVSGGAPLNADIARFFLAARLPILEGYGLTETSPVISVNTFRDLRLGSVGKPLPGIEVKIAPDGEIVTRGPNVMKGYFNNPEATREVLDADGWFHTGDIGEIDADGFLKITDRKKDLIVTAGGKNIAPQPIENIVRTCKWVLNAVMLGDRRAYPIMLVVPNVPLLREWARRHAYAFIDDDALLARSETHEKIEREVKRLLRDLARYEVPKRFVLVKEDFSIEAGELTPTMKVRRRVVEQRYKDRIEAAYVEGPGSPA